MFDSSGGGIHQTAIIGHPPELRDWKPTDPIYLPIIDPTARIHAYVTVDAGAQRPTSIGARSWLMKHVHVGHDVIVGDDCELAPGTVIAGEATLGNHVHIGVNATVLPGVTIGDRVIIGAGSVVTKNIADNETWAGNPARCVRLEGWVTRWTLSVAV